MSEKRNKKRISVPKFDMDKLTKFIHFLERYSEMPADSLIPLALGSFVYSIEDITIHQTKDFSITISNFLEQVSKLDFKGLSSEIDSFLTRKKP